MHRLKAVPPTFCRHNRFIENCSICRPKPEAPHAPKKRAASGAAPARARTGAGSRAPPGRPGGGGGRRTVQAADDGYRCDLVIGLKASADAERLAGELAF